MKKIIYLLFLSIIYCFPTPLFAETASDSQDCVIPTKYKTKPPVQGDKPVKINIGINIFDFGEIIDSKQTFQIDYLIEFSWYDPRLSENSLGFSLSNCEITLDDIWFPNLIIINQVSAEQKLSITKVDSQGNAKYLRRLLATFSNDFLYKDFPFDNQILKVSATAFEDDDVELVLDKENIKMNDIFSVEGWDITKLDPIYFDANSLGNSSDFSKVEIRFNAHRVRSYYIWKLIIPLCLIVLMAWAVFWIPPAMLGPQVSLSTATIFTLIAYRFSIGYQLPKIPYFTKMDKFVFASTLIVFMALGVAISTSYLATNGKEQLALRIEKNARFIYIILFILILLFSFLF